MKRLIAILIYLLVVGVPSAASAQSTWTKPPNVPTIFVQDYNVTIAVWVTGSVVGSYIAEFELHPDGKWYFGDGDSSGGDPGFDQTVAYYGGPQGWIRAVGIPRINPILATRFPPIGATPPGGATALDQVNNVLGASYSLKVVNGVAVLSPR